MKRQSLCNYCQDSSENRSENCPLHHEHEGGNAQTDVAAATTITTTKYSNASTTNAASDSATAETIDTVWRTRLTHDHEATKPFEEMSIDCAATARLVNESSKFTESVIDTTGCHVAIEGSCGTTVATDRGTSLFLK